MTCEGRAWGREAVEAVEALYSGLSAVRRAVGGSGPKIGTLGKVVQRAQLVDGEVPGGDGAAGAAGGLPTITFVNSLSQPIISPREYRHQRTLNRLRPIAIVCLGRHFLSGVQTNNQSQLPLAK